MSAVSLSVSYNTVIKVLDDLGQNHDAFMKTWRDNLIDKFHDTKVYYVCNAMIMLFQIAYFACTGK